MYLQSKIFNNKVVTKLIAILQGLYNNKSRLAWCWCFTELLRGLVCILYPVKGGPGIKQEATPMMILLVVVEAGCHDILSEYDE